MLVICGPAASGKDTIREELIKLGFLPVIDYTTRPMRKGERDDVNYHYISEEAFRTKAQNGEFAVTADFSTVYGIWSYGTDKRDIEDDRIAVLNPHGVKSLRDLGYRFYAVGLEVPEAIREQRLRKRNQNEDAAAQAELYRRLEADRKDFADMPEFCDSIVINDGTWSPKETAEQIYAEYKQWMAQQMASQRIP